MLHRRRLPGQRRAPLGTVAAAAHGVPSSGGSASSSAATISGATSLSAGQHPLSSSLGSGGAHTHPYYASLALGQAIDERVAAFAPSNLRSLLMNDAADEASSGVGTADDVTLVEGSARSAAARLAHALLFVYLHIGNDPPDFPRVEPCAKRECWVDPMVAHVAQGTWRSSDTGGGGGGSDSIAETLERQYRGVLREDLSVTRVVEASLETSKKALARARITAREGRLLVHYNGHGMPKATELGEVWMFDKERTHYVPLNITEMAELADTPTIYVFDCNSAGSLLQRWLRDRLQERRPHDLFICACSPGETLPLSPALPADLLTACLTTPLKMALEWYLGFSYHAVLLPRVTVEMIRDLPGDSKDRKSPRGELSWILNAVTDTIAWCTLPPAQFHYLLRQDSSVKSLFRNYILADRLLRESGCTPMTYPAISEEAHLHPMWELWEYTVDKCVSQLPRLLASTTEGSPAVYEPSTFFDDQLTAFEVWVESGNLSDAPEQLPCVLLALTQMVHRVPALTLLIKYLDSGRTAGRRAILCGLIPYMRKLFVPEREEFLLVMVLWMQVVRADPSEGCGEMLKKQCEKHFTRLLQLDEESIVMEYVEYGQAARRTEPDCALSDSPMASSLTPPSASPRRRGGLQSRSQAWDSSPGFENAHDGAERHRAQPGRLHRHIMYLMKNVNLSRCKSMSCYVLFQLLQRGKEQCIVLWNDNLLNAAFPCLSSTNAELRSWACLLLARLILGLRHAKSFVSKECASRLDLFTRLLQDRSPVVRSSCVTLLASIAGVRVDTLPSEQQVRRLHMEKSLMIKLREYVFDASMTLREELIFFCCQVLYAYRGLLSPAEREKTLEYVVAVGQRGGGWALEEAEVGIKSLLNSARPTVNSVFDDAVIFETAPLVQDDPLPSTPDVEESRLTPTALQMIQGLLHDAALLLYTLDNNRDSVLVRKALRSLNTGAAPQSQRFASEALRTMSRVASTDSAECQTEADRTRATWNADMMKQLVLDIWDRRLEPYRRDASVSVSPVCTQENRHRDATVASSWKHPPSSRVAVTAREGEIDRQLVLRSALPPDSVICTAFRVLEASMVVATRNQQISYVSYDNYNSQKKVHSFPVQLSGPLHDVHVINDLSEQSGLLLVDKRGGFTLMKSCWNPNEVLAEAAVFSACPPPPANRWLDLKSTYRSSTATLFFGGPIGPDGDTAIHLLSLAEEQVVQRLTVAGNPTLTSLETHTTQRCLLAGFADGVVRYYDDRQRQGQMGAVGMLECRAPGATGAGPVEAVMGAGPIATSAGFSIAIATRSALYVFDSRKLNEAQLCVSHQDLYDGFGERDRAARDAGFGASSSSLSPSPSSSSVTPTTPLAPRITGCSVGIHTGLVGLSFQNNTYAAYNAKGLILNDHPFAVLNGKGENETTPLHLPSQQRQQPAARCLLPGSCVAHPLRPMMTFGGELMFLQL